MIGINKKDLDIVQCPHCHGKLAWQGSGEDKLLDNGVLQCDNRHLWRVKEGVADLADRTNFSTKDRMLDTLFDFLAPVHDLSVEYLLPVLQYPDPDTDRSSYIDALDLNGKDLAKGTVRIIDIGTGPGANIDLIDNALPEKRKREIWAVDLNASMLKQFASAFRENEIGPIRLAGADGHKLPFGDSTFDRVLNVGGINLYHSPKQGLAEMARVAKPDTPIVVVDEGLDHEKDNNLLHHLAFKWLTMIDEIDEAPAHLLPAGCEIVDVSNISRFYYCLVYKKTNHDKLVEEMEELGYSS